LQSVLGNLQQMCFSLLNTFLKIPENSSYMWEIYNASCIVVSINAIVGVYIYIYHTYQQFSGLVPPSILLASVRNILYKPVCVCINMVTCLIAQNVDEFKLVL
jgi:hypothetical protein